MKAHDFIWRAIVWVGKKFWRIILVLILLSALLGCSPPDSKGKKKRLNYQRYPTYDLGYTLSTITQVEIPRCFSDGVITHKFKGLASQWRNYLDQNYSSASYQELVEKYQPYTKWMLTHRFRPIKGKAQKHVQAIVDDIIAKTPELRGMHYKVYIVENRTEDKLNKGYTSASTIPGNIFFGLSLYKIAMTKGNGGRHSLAQMICHEIGHASISFQLWEKEDAFTSSFLPKELAHYADKMIDVLRLPLSDAEEIYSDLFALKVLADHPSYDPMLGVRIYRVFRDFEDPSSIDWLDSHPLGSHRFACLLMILTVSRTFKKLKT